jgi:CHAT domain-containing protein/Tfp pilus assembly protein PilF
MKVYIALFFVIWQTISLNGQTPEPPKSWTPDPLEDSLKKYDKSTQLTTAHGFADQWLEKTKQNPGKDSLDFAAAMNVKGEIIQREKKPKQAKPYLQKALEIRIKVLGPDNPDVANSQYNLGYMFSDLGEFAKAETHFLLSLEINKKTIGPGHPKNIKVLNSLGFLYDRTDDFAKSENYYRQALELRKKSLGPEHPDVAASLNSLGLLYLSNSENPVKAEPHLLQALEIRKKTLGPEHTDVAKSLTNLGMLYSGLGEYAKAKPYHLQALEIRQNKLGSRHPEVAKSLWHLGILYRGLGDSKKAESYYRQALEIRKKTLEPDHTDIGYSLRNLGNLYGDFGLLAKAESYFLQTLDIWEKARFNVAPIQMNLGDVYFRKGNFSKAESLYQSAFEKLNFKSNSKYQGLFDVYFNNMGSLNRNQGKTGEAAYFIRKAAASEEKFLRQFLPALSEQGREAFFKGGSYTREKHKSFFAEEGIKTPALWADLYNHQLFYKGLLLNTSARWKQRIKTSGDIKLIRRYDEWEILQRKISRMLVASESSEQSGLDTLLEKAELLEKELSQRSENFAKKEDRKQRTWQEVQQTLKPGEAAIEMVRFLKYGIAKVVTDTSDPKKPTYRIKGLTDTVQYAALILTKTSFHPELVILPNGNNMEEKWYNYYRNSIRMKQKDAASYRNFWQPIGSKLKGIKKVWFSADGVYHKLNLGTLQNPATGKHVMEELEIALLGSTKDLLTGKSEESENRLACLVGNPDFQPGTQTSAGAKSRSGPEISYYFTPDPALEISSLPGTQVELDSVAGLLEQKGWEVQQYTGSSAAEEKIKDSYKPRVMLLSTHGFFRADTTPGSNPLLRSGLLLSGAAKTLREGRSGEGEDGILTAYEAMNLNLDNTELVVLSACETGLGDIRNGEGVYGLQRAFQVAGARNLIMSLWKVNDEVTRELMVAFFKNWTNGMKKRAAFLKAQKEIQKKYPDPYYWGAFVMVGE